MRRFRDLLILLGFAAITAGLGRLHPRLEVDVENVAMSSDLSPEAAVEARRNALFEPDSTLLLLAEQRAGAGAGAADSPLDAQSAQAWLDAIAAVPGVRAARKLPVDALHGGLFAAVDLEPDDAGAFVPAYRAAVAGARAAAPPGWRVSATGQVAGQAAISGALQAEGPRVLPILIVILALVLALTYRSLSLLVAAFLPAGGAVVWVGGLQVLLGLKLDPISTLLQPTLLTVGVAAVVHVLEATLTEREHGATADAAPGTAVRHVFSPALLALATTVAGFASLGFNAIPAVRSFGLLASVGVVVSCALTLVVVPAWLRIVPPHDKAARGRTWSTLAAPMTAWLGRHARTVVVGAGVLGVAAIGAWTQVRVDSDPMRLLPRKHPFRVASARIEAELGGFETFELLLGPPQPKGGPLALAALSGKLAGVDGIARLAGAPRTADDGTVLLTALLKPAGTQARDVTFAAAEEQARTAGWTDVEVTGLAVRMARDSRRMVAGQLSGLGLTTAAIVLMLVIGLRSVRLGLLGMLPNLLPCCLLYGGMAAFGRPLSISTAMIGTVFLGLVVDDAVHVLYAYRRARLAGREREPAIADAFRRAGRAITITSLALAAGFAACWLGRMETTREFGVLATAIVVGAFLADLVVLPALLLLRTPPRRTEP